MSNASSHTPIIQSSGIVFREDFQDPVSIRKNGGIINGTVPIKGKWSIFSNNVANYIEYPHLDIHNRTEITVGCWVRNMSTANWRALIGQMGSSNEFLLEFGTDSKFRLYVQTTNGLGSTASDAISDLASPHFVVGTWKDTNSVRIYVDGVEHSDTAHAGALVDSAIPLRIGVRHSDDYPVDGKIKDCFIIFRQLSAKEISDMYKNRTYR